MTGNIIKTIFLFVIIGCITNNNDKKITTKNCFTDFDTVFSDNWYIRAMPSIEFTECCELTYGTGSFQKSIPILIDSNGPVGYYPNLTSKSDKFICFIRSVGSGGIHESIFVPLNFMDTIQVYSCVIAYDEPTSEIAYYDRPRNSIELINLITHKKQSVNVSDIAYFDDYNEAIIKAEFVSGNFTITYKSQKNLRIKNFSCSYKV